MVQVDHQFARFVTGVTKGVLNLGFIAFGVGEVVIAHRHRAIFVDDGAFVFPTHGCVRCDCETAIFRALCADEVAQGFVKGAAELVFSCQRWVEENFVAIFIGVEGVDVVSRGGSKVAAFTVNLADVDDAFAPALLRCGHFFSCDWCNV